MEKNELSEQQTIKCDVHSCTHCDCSCDCCKLEAIKVCNCDDAKEKEATMCDSYKEKDE